MGAAGEVTVAMLVPNLRAFERTYRAEGPFVAAVLGRLAVPHEAVHDAVQDVFVAAYRRWPDYDHARPVRPWLTAFAHRVAFRYRRSQARRVRKRAALRHLHPVVQRPDDGRTEARTFLERFLGQLDEGHRRAYLLSEFEGCTAQEVADDLGISAQAVYGRVRSVRRRLQMALLDDAREPSSAAASLVPPWALLVPRLGEGSAVAAAGAWGAVKVAALAIGLSVAAVATVASVRVEQPPLRASSQSPAAASIATGSAPEPAARRRAPADAPAPPSAAGDPVLVRTRSTSPTAPAAAVEPPSSDLAAEADLLRRARSAQDAGRLRDAMALLDHHAQRYPSGQLEVGRRRARIRVLCDLGRAAQARGEALMLAHDRPGDPLAVQSVSICTAPIQSASRPEKQGVEP